MVTDNSNASTQSSLLRRVRQPEDQEAWGDFVSRYGSLVLKWCRNWQMQDADAHDLTQEILVRVWRKLPTFEYDPERSFRAWLWTLSRHAFLDSVKQKVNVAHIDQARVEGQLDKLAIEFASSVEREFERELLQLACREVEQVVTPRDWDVFVSTTFRRIDAKHLAQRYQLRLSAVYVVNQRVRKQIKNAMERLENSMNESEKI